MALKLLAPGTRKNNPFWLARGSVLGREYEVSTETQDQQTAEEFAKAFERAVREDRERKQGIFYPEVTVLPIERIYAMRRQPNCGVYFLFQDLALHYIGQSSSTARRIAKHVVEKRIPFNNWCGIDCEIPYLDLAEATYILEFKPPYNRGLRRASPSQQAGLSPPIRGGS